jgi:hypothetical protein
MREFFSGTLLLRILWSSLCHRFSDEVIHDEHNDSADDCYEDAV